MTMDNVARNGLVLLGCGKMGSAMLAGWLKRGLPPESVWVIDPKPSDWLQSTGVTINGDLPEQPAIVLVAVKPQMMGDALPAIAAIIGNSHTPPAHLDTAEELLTAVGQVVRLDSEDQMDAVTGVSGSGPAYVFHMIECLAKAGEAQGLSPDLAMQLAQATVAGAGALAEEAEETPDQLRVNVTSPNGTTQAGLEVLMDEDTGLPPLMKKTVAAATDRSKELRNG